MFLRGGLISVSGVAKAGMRISPLPAVIADSFFVLSPLAKTLEKELKLSVHYDKASSDKFSFS